MADSGSRQLQVHAVDRHTEAAAGDIDSDDIDYEPPTEVEGDDQSDEDILERFLDEGEGVGGDGGNESGLQNYFSSTSPANPPQLSCITTASRSTSPWPTKRKMTQRKENEVSLTSYLLYSRPCCSYFDSKLLGKEDRSYGCLQTPRLGGSSALPLTTTSSTM